MMLSHLLFSSQKHFTLQRESPKEILCKHFQLQCNVSPQDSLKKKQMRTLHTCLALRHAYVCSAFNNLLGFGKCALRDGVRFEAGSLKEALLTQGDSRPSQATTAS